jgi:hypothetical protein
MVSEYGLYKATRIISTMMNDRNDEINGAENDQPNDEQASRDKSESAETDSGADDYKRDEDKRGERPDNLRRRSAWFQKRAGGK